MLPSLRTTSVVRYKKNHAIGCGCSNVKIAIDCAKGECVDSIELILSYYVFAAIINHHKYSELSSFNYDFLGLLKFEQYS